MCGCRLIDPMDDWLADVQGAGYAGGIVSAAVDGIHVGQAVLAKLTGGRGSGLEGDSDRGAAQASADYFYY